MDHRAAEKVRAFGTSIFGEISRVPVSRTLRPQAGLQRTQPVIESTETVILYRAVRLDEADDLRALGQFRLGQGSAFVEGKWFAASFGDAVR